MADDKKNEKEPVTVELKPGQVVVSQDVLAKVLEQQAETERELENIRSKNAGLEALFEEGKGAEPSGEKKLRTRKDFQPAFRTVTLKKFPIGGDYDNKGIVIGWTNRGAYQKVDRSGVAPVTVDYLDVIFLGHEKTVDGKLQVEAVPLLQLMGAEEIFCKVLEDKRLPKVQPTGEEIRITTFDPKHGLIETGETIDGYVEYTERTFTLQVPGIADPVIVDEKFCNA